MKQDFLPDEIFQTIITHTPLVSVDLIVKKEEKILLGKRVNNPAKDYWFTLGGRILKGEMIQDAIQRIAQIELGQTLKTTPRYLGTFEHIYDDSIYEGVSTHYINLGYEVEVDSIDRLPKEQHHDYKWLSLKELMTSTEVHPYVKDYFSPKMGSIPQ